MVLGSIDEPKMFTLYFDLVPPMPIINVKSLIYNVAKKWRKINPVIDHINSF